LIVDNGTIITLDARRRTITDGCIVVTRGRIEAVGKSSEMRKLHHADRRIDASGKFVFPGLVNTHTHSFQALLKGLGDDKPYTDWFPQVTGPSAAKLTPDDCYIAALLTCIDAIRSGTTCILDFMYAHPCADLSDEIVQAFRKIGIRGILARGIIDTGEDSGALPEIVQDLQAALNDCERLFKTYNGLDDRIYVWIAPCSIWTVTRECIEASRILADKLKMHITSHVSEVPFERENSLRRFGMRDLEFMDRLGLTGPDMLAVHCVDVTRSDIAILGSKHVKVSHNPICNMYMSSGVAPVPQILRAGVTVSLGTDGAASNNNQDMIQTLKTTALLHKLNDAHDPAEITCEKVLEMATIDGARSLGLDAEIGSIEVGKRADIVIMDFLRANTTPVHYPASTLVYSASNANVETVIVNGGIVLENGRMLTVDEDSILKLGQEKAQALMYRAGIERFSNRSWRSIKH
jgi:5-methylthioadenosine/S-adenosylhomocysteine deaminase